MAGQGMRGARQGAGAGNRADLGGLWGRGLWVSWSLSWSLGLGVLPDFRHFTNLLKSLNYATFKSRGVSRDP
jgi:hypothetical protein